MEQLDIIELFQKQNVIRERLNHIIPLLEKYNQTSVKIIAVNKYYEWSFVGEEDGYIHHYNVYHNRFEKHSLLYPFERVQNETINFWMVN